MRIQVKKSVYKKIALVLSLCALILWAVLGTGASLAWFTDTTPEINNIFHFAEFDVAVSHYINDDWESIDGKTDVFDKEALYEPGYVQVVYLKVENKGTLPFKFHTAVNVNDCTAATNVFGQQFLLQDYLKFGVITGLTEQDVISSTLEREIAKDNANILVKDIADMPLHTYDTETAVLQPKGKAFLALIIRMPEEVNNVANYRGNTQPTVELGITVKAEQIR